MATEEELTRVREALATCSSETKRLVNEDVVAIPAIQHMLSTFLADKSRWDTRDTKRSYCVVNISRHTPRVQGAT